MHTLPPSDNVVILSFLVSIVDENEETIFFLLIEELDPRRGQNKEERREHGLAALPRV